LSVSPVSGRDGDFVGIKVTPVQIQVDWSNSLLVVGGDVAPSAV